MPTKHFNSSAHKLGHTEAEIQLRAASTDGPWWLVRCLNGNDHQNDDETPSAYYNAETGWYGCRVCGLKGFANDRDRANWSTRQTRTYTNGSIVHRGSDPRGKRIWQENPQPTELPYNIETVHANTKTIYMVEGEKCVEALRPHLDATQAAVVTSIGGSNAPQKTNWSPVREALDRGCEILFIPDRDAPGEKYILAIAKLLRLKKIKAIRLGGDRDDGYDIADWLTAGHDLTELENHDIEQTAVQKRAAGYPDLFGYHEEKELCWLADNMIPARKISLLFGRAKIGKSAMALYIASCVSKQRQPFTDKILASPSPLTNEPHKILIYSSEDDWNDAIGVRLKMMGANMDNIAPLRSQLDPKRNFDWETKQGRDELTEFGLLLGNLEESPVSLLVVDPLIDIITGGNNNDAATIRRAVIGIHHERKGVKDDDMLIDRSLGSQAWPAVARSVMYMQALKKRIALGGKGKNASPRATADNKYNIAMRDLGTNSEIMGVVCVSDSNYAAVDGGYHYELPTSTPENQSSSFIEVVVNTKKITSQTPQALVECYNPMRKVEMESAANKKARVDLGKEVWAVRSAEAVVKEVFEELAGGRILTSDLLDRVMKEASVGKTNAQEAIRNLTDRHREGNAFYRMAKKRGNNQSSK